MAKCIDCDYPYSTRGVCPNCGSNDPRGTVRKGCGQMVAISFCVLFIAVIFSGLRSCIMGDDKPSIAKNTSASHPEKADSVKSLPAKPAPLSSPIQPVASTPIKPASPATPASNQFFGIGITFARQRIGVRDQLIIQAITPDSPASKNPSIRVGQHVLSINNVTTNFKSVEDCVNLVRMNDPVTIEVQTSSTSATSFSIDKANFNVGPGQFLQK